MGAGRLALLPTAKMKLCPFNSKYLFGIIMGQSPGDLPMAKFCIDAFVVLKYIYNYPSVTEEHALGD